MSRDQRQGRPKIKGFVELFKRKSGAWALKKHRKKNRELWKREWEREQYGT